MNCLNCKHCHPLESELIRCDHPQWEEVREEGEDDTEMRTFSADFGEACEDFEEMPKQRPITTITRNHFMLFGCAASITKSFMKK